VLEAIKSDHLTYFYPPMNLLVLIFIRPLRLVCSAARIREYKITLLKITHAPMAAIIFAYEHIHIPRAYTMVSFAGAQTQRQPIPSSGPPFRTYSATASPVSFKNTKRRSQEVHPLDQATELANLRMEMSKVQQSLQKILSSLKPPDSDKETGSS
jgi:hypothetical protein